MGGVGEVVVRHLDLSDLASVRTFAKEVLDEEKAIHVLVSAGGAAKEKRGTGNYLSVSTICPSAYPTICK